LSISEGSEVQTTTVRDKRFCYLASWEALYKYLYAIQYNTI